MVVLLVAFQLGYEQGRRSRKEEVEMLELIKETQKLLREDRKREKG
jgi:hypothetical protein